MGFPRAECSEAGEDGKKAAMDYVRRLPGCGPRTGPSASPTRRDRLRNDAKEDPFACVPGNGGEVLRKAKRLRGAFLMSDAVIGSSAAGTEIWITSAAM